MNAESPEERARRAASFNEDAERYDRARPTYPEELFDELWRIAELSSAPNVVEVGCGTGQSSRCLVNRGARLTCVELGANMAAVARRNLAAFRSAQVIVSRFEDWDPGGQVFDLVYASASWHWIKPDLRYAKSASVLRSGGSLAIVHSEHFYPEGHDPLFVAIQDVYQGVIGSRKEVTPQRIPAPGEYDSRDLEQIAEMDRLGAFETPTVCRILWHIERTADQYVDLLGTFSDHWALEPEKRARLFERIHGIIARSLSGRIRKHYLTTLRVACKR